MESITKTKLTSDQITEMTKRAFGVFPETIEELTDGYFNSAYMIKLANGERTVLKVSPAREVLVMRYEKNIMEAEVNVLNKIYSQKNVPVPKVLYYDQNRDIADSEFFFMDFIEGVPLNKVRDELTPLQLKEIKKEAGMYAKNIKITKSNYFGYISQNNKRFNTWSAAFSCMIKELLDDAYDMGVVLPCNYQRIYDAVKEKGNILDMVKTPSLVHKDLWEGNVFVDPIAAKITGFVDFERAIYADALLEPVCGFLLDNEEFMMNYLGKTSLTDEEKTRTILYRIYLFLIMFIECSFRKYPGDESEKRAREQLEIALAELGIR